ncbi:MAG: PLP-dependent aminotransferase family protein [Actinomycetota bacterium]|nr:PLP-dependent aminotransferase family protein [Actinomycetota bacterium]
MSSDGNGRSWWEALLSEEARTASSSAIRDLLRHAQRPDVISLAGGLPTPELFPIDDLRAATDRVLAERGRDVLQYGLTEGLTELRELAAARATATDGAPARPEQVLVTSGSQQGLDLVGRCLLDPGDVVVVDDPGYIGALQALRGRRPRLVGIPLDAEGMRTDVLAEHLADGLRPKLCYTNPTFQNPTGATLSVERRRHLAELAARYGFVIIDDDPYGALRYSGEWLPSPASFDAEHVVRLRSTSKVLVPGLRIGWVIGPEWLLDRLVIAKQAVDLHTSTLSQVLAHELLRDPTWLDAHVEQLRPWYRNQRDALLEALGDELGDRARTNPPDGGMFCWVELPEGTDTTALLTTALDCGVAFVPGGAFAIDRPCPDTARLSFATESPERLAEAVRRLRTALDRTTVTA